MAPVTEMPVVTFKEGADMSKLDSVATTLLQQPGCRAVSGSRLHEDPSKYRLFIDWESIERHEDFMARDVFQAFLAELGELVAGPPTVYHTALSPFPPTVLKNGEGKEGKAKTPVAELLHAYFPSGDAFTPDLMAATSKTMQGFLEALDAAAGARGASGESAAGWVVEELDFKGEKCRAFVLALGWESVDAHMRFRDTPEFARIIPMLRGLEGLKGMEMCHVSTKTW